MKTLVAVLLALPLVVSAQDSWTGADKPKHFAVSAAAGLAAGAILPSLAPECGKWCRVGVAMVPGVLKELGDTGQAGNRFSWRDLVWDAAGAYAGVTLSGFVFRPNAIAYRTEF